MAQTVLVTGASGFVAAHVLNEFLGAGYNVRAAVRSEATANKVRGTHGKYGDALSFVIVPDMSVPGAFDEAVKGVDGIIHTASPFILEAKDYEKELFQPAVNGTVSVLKAAKANNPNVKRIVITSSFAAILDVTKGDRAGYAYTEADWNPMTPEETIAAGPVAAYLVSKTLAERAAFDFVEQEKPNFSITTFQPPMVYGPIAHAVSSMSSLNTSSADMYRLFNGSSKEVPDNGFKVFVDVRDLAKAHLLGYESPAAANQRYAISPSNYSFQQFVDIIRTNFPELKDKTPVGEPNKPLPDTYTLDTTKIQKELGLKYHSMEDTVIDAVKALKELEKNLS